MGRARAAGGGRRPAHRWIDLILWPLCTLPPPTRTHSHTTLQADDEVRSVVDKVHQFAKQQQRLASGMGGGDDAAFESQDVSGGQGFGWWRRPGGGACGRGRSW